VHTASSSQLGALEKGVADAKGLVTEATKRVQACPNKVLAATQTVTELVLVAQRWPRRPLLLRVRVKHQLLPPQSHNLANLSRLRYHLPRPPRLWRHRLLHHRL
jgi:hypothetical protein